METTSGAASLRPGQCALAQSARSWRPSRKWMRPSLAQPRQLQALVLAEHREPPIEMGQGGLPVAGGPGRCAELAVEIRRAAPVRGRLDQLEALAPAGAGLAEAATGEGGVAEPLQDGLSPAGLILGAEGFQRAPEVGFRLVVGVEGRGAVARAHEGLDGPGAVGAAGPVLTAHEHLLRAVLVQALGAAPPCRAGQRATSRGGPGRRPAG